MYRYRRQIRLLTALLVLAGAAYGGLKVWMHVNVQKAMEELSVAAAGRAEIRYQGIDTDLGGSVTVRGLEVVPAEAPVPLHIESARLSGPSLKFFLLGQKRSDAPPRRMFLDIDGIRVDLDPALFTGLQESLGASNAAVGSGCGAGDELNPQLLRDMGFEQLRVNVAFSYEYDEPSRRFDGQLDFDIEQMERMQASMSLGDVAPDAMAGGMSGLPTLAGMALSMRVEPAFGRKYLETCAARANISVDDFRQQLVADTRALMARAGLQLGAGLSNALAEFHRDWGEFSVSAQPPAPLNPMALMFSPPGDWQRALGLRASLNQRPITDLSFELRPPDADELAILLGEETAPSGPRVKPPRYRRVFRTVTVGNLSHHVGAEVILHMGEGQPERHGLLVEVSGEELRVQQRLHGGKMTAHVPLREIVSAEVQFVEKIPDKR